MFGESGEVCIFSPQIGYDLTAFLYMKLLGTFDVLGRIMERNKALPAGRQAERQVIYTSLAGTPSIILSWNVRCLSKTFDALTGKERKYIELRRLEFLASDRVRTIRLLSEARARWSCTASGEERCSRQSSQSSSRSRCS